MIVKCGAKGGHLKRLLIKIRIELLKRRKRRRVRHAALGYCSEGAARNGWALRKASISITAEHFSELYRSAQRDGVGCEPDNYLALQSAVRHALAVQCADEERKAIDNM